MACQFNFVIIEVSCFDQLAVWNQACYCQSLLLWLDLLVCIGLFVSRRLVIEECFLLGDSILLEMSLSCHDGLKSFESFLIGVSVCLLNMRIDSLGRRHDSSADLVGVRVFFGLG